MLRFEVSADRSTYLIARMSKKPSATVERGTFNGHPGTLDSTRFENVDAPSGSEFLGQ